MGLAEMGSVHTTQYSTVFRVRGSWVGIGVGGGCLVGLLGETLISPLCVNGPLLSCEWHLHIQYIIHSRGHERER